MSLIVPIPLTNGEPSPYFDMQVALEGITFTFQIRWNARASAWFLDVLDATGTNLLRAGIRLVADWPLDAYAPKRTPSGALVAVDSSGAGRDPTVDDLGLRVKLLYFSSVELAG